MAGADKRIQRRSLHRGLKAEALNSIPNLVDSSYEEFQEDVRVRMEILKKMKTGVNQSFKGKSKVGFHSFYGIHSFTP